MSSILAKVTILLVLCLSALKHGSRGSAVGWHPCPLRRCMLLFPGSVHVLQSGGC